MTPLFCLAATVFFEARDQPPDGQQAVADVVMTRVDSPRWPDTVCAVVYQHKQFSYTHDGLSDDYRLYTSNPLERQAIVKSEAIAKETLSRTSEDRGLTSTHYHTTKVSPRWSRGYQHDDTIGDHMFFTEVR